MALGPHKIEFEVIEGWDQMPDGWTFFEVAGVACDSRDHVYVFNRGEYPVIIFDKEGKFLNAWGEGVFKTRTAFSSTTTITSGLPTTRTTRSTSSRPTARRLMTIGESGKAVGYRLRDRRRARSSARPGRFIA